MAEDSRFPASVGWIDRDRTAQGVQGRELARAQDVPLLPGGWSARYSACFPTRLELEAAPCPPRYTRRAARASECPWIAKYYLFENDSGSDKRSIRRAGGDDSGLRGCVGLLHTPENLKGDIEVNRGQRALQTHSPF